MNLRIVLKTNGRRRWNLADRLPTFLPVAPVVRVLAMTQKSPFAKPMLVMLAMVPVGNISARKDRKHHGLLAQLP